MKEKAIIHKLTPYKQGMQIEEVKRKYGLDKIVKLASNENPFGYSDRIDHKLKEIAGNFAIYPDGHAADLRKKLASKLKVNEDQLVFGNGSDELIQLISRVYLEPGVNTVMANPSFPQYKHNALMEGAEIREIPVQNGYLDLDGMLHAIDDKTAIVWLCSPNNPTGCLIPKESFYSFLDKCPETVLVVLDEAYYEYINPLKNANAISLLDQYANLLILRTFSKAYGLAGLRIGYGVANESIISKLNIVRGPFNTTAFSQQAAMIALDDEAFVEETIQKNNENRKAFQQFLDQLGWHYYDSETNFLLVETPGSGTEMFAYLLENGFIVRPGEGLGCPNTVRITIGQKQDMEQLQAILQKLHVKLQREKTP